MSILQRIFGIRAGASEVDPIIDRVVAATDPRLSLVKGYRESLRAPVVAARERLRQAVARIPGPTETSATAWSRDDTVRALFAKGSDIAAVVSNDAGACTFFAAHPGADSCIAMLALEKRERRVLASALHGDNVQAEVARTTVSFAEPLILAPGMDHDAVRAELVVRGLEFLSLRALQRVGSMRSRKLELEKERALITAQLRLATARGTGFGALDSGAPKAGLERELERVVRELEAAASRRLLPTLLEEIIRSLEEPGESITVEPCGFALDAMNFVAPPGAPGTAIPLIAVLRLAHRGPFGVVIARFPRTELKAAASFADARFI